MIKQGFAIWITGLPGSGKTVTSQLLAQRLKTEGIPVQILESDELRRVLTPHPTYSEEERDVFYNSLIYIGLLLVQNGVNVIFDATANRRKYRERARREIKNFVEAYLKCPLEVCKARDVKGIYRKALQGLASTVPGLQADYEEPESPEVILESDREAPSERAEKIFQKLKEFQLI